VPSVTAGGVAANSTRRLADSQPAGCRTDRGPPGWPRTGRRGDGGTRPSGGTIAASPIHRRT